MTACQRPRPSARSAILRTLPSPTLRLGYAGLAFQCFRPRRKAAVKPATTFPRLSPDLARFASPVPSSAAWPLPAQLVVRTSARRFAPAGLFQPTQHSLDRRVCRPAVVRAILVANREHTASLLEAKTALSEKPESLLLQPSRNCCLCCWALRIESASHRHQLSALLVSEAVKGPRASRPAVRASQVNWSGHRGRRLGWSCRTSSIARRQSEK